jgi:hypothetical protein
MHIHTQKLIEEAKNNPNGWVYEIDYPYLPNDHTPPEAIVGAWKVNNHGEIEGAFQSNVNYRPIEILNKNLPAYMLRQNKSEAGMWISEIDIRCEHLFPDIPKEAMVGYWLVGPDGITTNNFRPCAKYAPDKIPEILALKNL